MIRVTNVMHRVEMPIQIKTKLLDMVSNAVLLRLEGKVEESEHVVSAAQRIYEEWKCQAEASVKGKSHENWLGGGESYVVLPGTSPREEFQNMYEMFRQSLGDEIHVVSVYRKFSLQKVTYGNKMSIESLKSLRDEVSKSFLDDRFMHMKILDRMIQQKEQAERMEAQTSLPKKNEHNSGCWIVLVLVVVVISFIIVMTL